MGCLAAGTSWSRSGNCPTASCAPISLATVATSMLLLCLPMALCVHLVARTVWPCCGTSTRGSVSILSHASRVISSMLSAATDNGIRIWDLEGKGIVDELKLEMPVQDPKSKALPTSCISLAWSSDGNTLFAGYTDSQIRIWQVTTGQAPIY